MFGHLPISLTSGWGVQIGPKAVIQVRFASQGYQETFGCVFRHDNFELDFRTWGEGILHAEVSFSLLLVVNHEVPVWEPFRFQTHVVFTTVMPDPFRPQVFGLCDGAGGMSM